MRTKYHNEKQAESAWEKTPEQLKEFGFSELRPYQTECLKSIYAGEDTLCVLPTGAGKSLLFALATKVLKYRTVVFVPLIALMDDQVESMLEKGIRAASLNSSQTNMFNSIALQDWCNGELDMLFVSPERMDNKTFINAMKMLPPDMVVVDEAHALSQWSKDFRPAYMRCGEFIEEYNPKQVISLTATATKQVVEDIKNILSMPELTVCRMLYDRSNLHFKSKKLSSRMEVWADIKRYINNNPDKNILIYCYSTDNVVSLAQYLHPIEVGVYSSKVSAVAKKNYSNNFKKGELKVLVATSSWGMGVDKPDIDTVIHADLPCTLEALSQEVGRAARDGRDADCIAYICPESIELQKLLWNGSNPPFSAIQSVYRFYTNNVGSAGYCDTKNEDCINAVGIDDKSMMSINSFLLALGAIERKPQEAVIMIRMKKSLDSDEVTALRGTKQRIIESITNGGIEIQTDVFKVATEYMVKNAGVQSQSVMTNLKQMSEAGILEYVTPKKNMRTFILRDLTEEDKNTADEKRSLGYKALELVQMYCNIPDANKSKFLMSYFEM